MNITRTLQNTTAIENTDDILLRTMQQMPAIQLEQMGKIKLMNRTDTKFLTNKEGLMKVLELARDDYFVQEIKGKRIARYRTTYWDTDDHDFYVMHHNGHKPRLKVRVRTYEDSQGLTYLEIKRKDNHGKTKKRRTEVKSQTEVIESGGDTYLLEQTGIHIDTLHPCLQNYFKRITLVNKGKTERLTIDYDIQYTNFETHKTADSGNLVIIELKRDGLVFSPIKEILTELRIRPHGYSKYIFGSFLTNDNLKSNLIKPKYAEIKKLL